MNGESVGTELKKAADLTSEYSNIRLGGNLGMAFVAQAIERHADAIDHLARAIEAGVSVDLLLTMGNEKETP